MTKLNIESRAYDLFCRANWFYCLVNLSRSGGEDYQYFKNDLTHSIAITEQEFNAAKYGAGIRPFEPGEEVVPLPDGGSVRCFYQSSVVQIFDQQGVPLRILPGVTVGCAIYSIALDADGHLWTADPCFHFVGQYDLATEQPLWQLGGDWDPTEFNHPEDVAAYGEYLFISDMGNQRLVLLNTRTKSFGTYRTFDQPVWQYRQFQGRELVRLSDGIYLL